MTKTEDQMRTGSTGAGRRIAQFNAVLAALLLMAGQQAQGQTHTTGLAVTKTCPVFANNGSIATCTVTIENLDPDHGVAALTVTDQVPFPGGVITPVIGCAPGLAPSDGIQG